VSLDKKTKILIIDDEELICWSLKKSLERNEEYSVSCVYTGDAALKSISENRYDVVITDLKLPDVNGVEILEKIKGLIRDTPLIVISAYLSDPSRYDIAGFDIFRCVNKPFEISDIMRGVKDAMKCKDKRFQGVKVSRGQGFK
jgi:DNA-binding NtrC family response regulator